MVNVVVVLDDVVGVLFLPVTILPLKSANQQLNLIDEEKIKKDLFLFLLDDDDDIVVVAVVMMP